MHNFKNLIYYLKVNTPRRLVFTLYRAGLILSYILGTIFMIAFLSLFVVLFNNPIYFLIALTLLIVIAIAYFWSGKDVKREKEQQARIQKELEKDILFGKVSSSSYKIY